MLIKAKKLSKVYGSGENQVVALDKVDLTVAPGDFISIIGPSGSGKSTLLHLLSGLDHPTSGSLTYDGQEIYTLSDKELSAFRRRQMGFIFQQFNLLPVLTARENILMPLLLDKKQPDEGYLNQLAELLGLRWQDVDLDGHTITIRQTSNYLPGKGVYVGTPKTTTSARPLPISTAAIMLLLEYRAWQDTRREQLGDAWEDQDGRVFTTDTGVPMFPTA